MTPAKAASAAITCRGGDLIYEVGSGYFGCRTDDGQFDPEKFRKVATLIPDGATLLIGGFMGVGSPHRLIDAIVARGTCGLTVIAEPTHIVPIGMITPDAVRTPGILVDYILERAR